MGTYLFWMILIGTSKVENLVAKPVGMNLLFNKYKNLTDEAFF